MKRVFELVIGLCAAFAYQADAQVFQTPKTIPTLIHPNSVAVTDFNLDGRMDLLVPCWTPNKLMVLLGDGTGGIGSQLTFDLAGGGGPRFVVTADFNNDGFPDAATPNSESGDVTVLLGNGSNALTPVGRIASGLIPFHLATADVNNDGALDLLVANSGTNTVSVLTGDNTGNFTKTGTIIVGTTPRSVIAADFNLDGNVDLAVANFGSHNVQILHGNGAATFTVVSTIATGTNPFTMGSGDLNGDGRADLAVPNFGASTVNILLAQNNGTLALSSTVTVGKSPRSALLKDVNNDGVLDLLTANYDNNSVSVVSGNGTGGFTSRTDFGVGGGPFFLALVDLDQNGTLDMATSDRDASTISISQGIAGGKFLAPAVFPTGNNPRGVAARDVDGDGFLDMAFANNSGNNVSFFKGIGAGQFASAVNYSADQGPWGIKLEDVSGDGLTDLVVVNSSKNNISVLKGTGTGTFLAQQKWSVGSGPRGLVIEDFNSDGVKDIATVNYSGNTISLLLGTGNGNFASHIQLATGTTPTSIASSDVNNDGNADIVVCNSVSSSVTVFIGSGSGTFTPTTISGTGATPSAIAVMDQNHDGNSDFLVANENGNTVTVFNGNGAGGFVVAGTIPVGTRPLGVAVGDVTADGLDDLLIANGTSENISILVGQETGGFSVGTTLSAGIFARALALGDADSDTRVDVIVANANGNDGWVLLNRGNFTAAGSPPVVEPQSITCLEDNTTSIVLSATDPDGDVITFSIQQGPTNGTLSGSVPNLTYTPNANFSGADAFIFVANDGLLSASAVVSISVTPVNDAPTALAKFVTVNEDTPAAITLQGTDPDFDTLSFILASSPTQGTLSGVAPNLTYTPNSNVNGADQFTFRVSDGHFESGVVTVSININAVNDLPVINLAIADQLVQGEVNFTSVELAGRFSDVETANGALALSATSSDPTLIVPSISGTLLGLDLTPNRGGSANITVRATDENGGWVEDSFLVTIVRAGARVTITDTNRSEGSPAGLVFTVSLSTAAAENVTVSYVAQGATATAGTDFTAGSGVLIFAPGITKRTITIPVISDVIDEENETVNLMLTGATGATIDDDLGVGTILDDDTASLRVLDLSMGESAGTANVQVTLSTACDRDITVNFTTANVSAEAIAGKDYVATSGTLLFPAGSTTTQIIPVDILTDTMDENDQAFSVNLSGAVNAIIGRAAARVNILDDDNAPYVSIGDVSITEGNSGTKTIIFTLTLSEPSEVRTRVRFDTADQTAIAGQDYVAKTGEIIFDAGVTNRTLPVTVSGDVLFEDNEFFTINLHTPTRLNILTPQGLGVILNDDPAP